MAPLNRVIIDTDPGIDDVLAILLALTAKPEELEVLMLSLTFGNVPVKSCLQNVVSMFHVIEKELEWRRQHGKPEGFETLRAVKPIVAVGAHEPLGDQLLMEDFFHGADGLGGVHESHPHLTPSETWKKLFEPPSEKTELAEAASSTQPPYLNNSFVPSNEQAHKEILRLLRENDPDTITIVAVGPLTNLALAAAEDPETFLRVKEVVVMGGAIDVEGNVTPVAEFNTCADAVASAQVFALTSPNPHSTIPPRPPSRASSKPGPIYPATLSRPLKLSLFPLDITGRHALLPSHYKAKVTPLIAEGSPLAEWANVFINYAFKKMQSLYDGLEGDAASIHLHDPLCVWYALTSNSPAWMMSPGSPEDIRIETSGQWTRGMHVVDRRNKTKSEGGEDGHVKGDPDGWLSTRKGNRIRRFVASPGEEIFGDILLDRIFG
ncbi:MAG: hypothetical protein M1834_008151 [Cirrosporium novae-zelandiae]|nr:MAG: hypothetical protein M1834_008151 [Cirrosporium novae-zelandiae]